MNSKGAILVICSAVFIFDGLTVGSYDGTGPFVPWSSLIPGGVTGLMWIVQPVLGLVVIVLIFVLITESINKSVAKKMGKYH